MHALPSHEGVVPHIQGKDGQQPAFYDGCIPSSTLPSFLCALGEYPSMKQQADLLAELHVPSKSTIISGSTCRPASSRISLQSAFAIWWNHRAISGRIGLEDIEGALCIVSGGASPSRHANLVAIPLYCPVHCNLIHAGPHDSQCKQVCL